MTTKMLLNSHLFGANMSYVEELYEGYLLDPSSVQDHWRVYFDELSHFPGTSGQNSPDVPHRPVIDFFAARAKEDSLLRGSLKDESGTEKQVQVLKLINAYRFLGNRWANLDPLKMLPRPTLTELEPSYYGFTEADLGKVFKTGHFAGKTDSSASLREIISACHQTYCGNIGVEYMYLSSDEEKTWLKTKLETDRSTPNYTDEEKKELLRHVTQAETLERYLHTRYVGQKRFSLEGGESAIVAMNTLVKRSGQHGAKEVVIGMAHRGRLNVLVNVLGKQPSMLFEEFEGKKPQDLSTGDVKYHLGYSSDVGSPGGPVHLTLAFNPSHLEIVNPVVAGSVYARQIKRDEGGRQQVLPVIIHGDAAVSGQGVNQEMLNFSQTRGYGTGGSVHFIINNQIGFTTSDSRDLRSSLYCTEIFKMVEAPIFHVNGDDPEAVAYVTELAVDFRNQFGKDVVIDIFCFRKLGHNEQDEPMVTQPLMYKKIAEHPGTRRLYANKLIAQGVLKEEDTEKMISDYRAALDEGHHLIDPVLSEFKNQIASEWSQHINIEYTEKCDTRVSATELERLSLALTTVPDSFVIHPRVKKVLEDRALMGKGLLPVDWGMGENLAYASLLAAGYHIRLSGEDVGRGTFFHRHATLHDQARTERDKGSYRPLQNIQSDQASFRCYDSVLSEEAVLAFEYGFATAAPGTLVVWEAQFGDFANGAQVVVDQFLSSGESKWGRGCGLIMLLPHGYEGQGPEHSSARIERYLQLSAQLNWEVCVPSNAAQIFHLIRRQMIRKQRKPLIVMTPKSLLRNKAATSSLDALSTGTFQTIIGETESLDVKKVQRLVICSGKVYYDLLAARTEHQIDNVALARVEQLYPFDDKLLSEEVARYTSLKEIIWCQEEPLNQGAWYAKMHRLIGLLKKGQTLDVVARPSSSSPAVGYASLHLAEQKKLIETALKIKNNF